MSRTSSSQCAPVGRTVAITAIEHGTIVITVASLIRECKPLPSGGVDGTFLTTILGGPLAGETWEGMSWAAMIRNHAGAVTRVAALVGPEEDQWPCVPQK